MIKHTALFLSLLIAASDPWSIQQDKLRKGDYKSTEITGKDTKALVLVDKRLYDKIANDLNAYIKAAMDRRKFTITAHPVDGIDDWQPAKVREYVQKLHKEYSKLEGILYVGNIKLPSFFMPRGDQTSTRLWPRYYEDLDMLAEQRMKPGASVKDMPTGCKDFKWKDVRPPKHDFDWVEQGLNMGPELWASFLPVGHNTKGRNNYDGWAEQLKPFFKKVLNFYKNPSSFGRALYLVSNDLNDPAQLEPVWKAVGPKNIDFYAINESAKDDNGKKPPRGGNDLMGGKYVRAPMEKYDSLKAFLEYAKKLPKIGEGWQKSDVFLRHMNEKLHRIVWWNVHSNETLSIISSGSAKTIKQGGLIALVTGCSVGGFSQPNSSSHVDTNCTVEGNFLTSIVYGNSAFVAATGCPHNRVSNDEYEPLFEEVYNGGYLGMGHKKQMLKQEKTNHCCYELRGRHEILIGDPFVDASE